MNEKIQLDYQHSETAVRKLSSEDLSLALDLLGQGLSVRKVAKQLKVAPSTLTERLIRAYGKDYLAQHKPTRTFLLLQEYSQGQDPKLREAAQKFLESDQFKQAIPSQRSFLTLKEEKIKSWSENFINLDYSFLDSRKGRGICKLC